MCGGGGVEDREGVRKPADSKLPEDRVPALLWEEELAWTHMHTI